MDILSEGWVKTRKPHRCWGCCREIPAKMKLHVIVSVDAGTIVRAYWCDICEAVISDMDSYDLDQGFDLGDVKQNYPDEWAAAKQKMETSQ